MQRFISLLALAGLALGGLSYQAQAEDAATKIKVLIITGDDVAVHPWKETTAAIRKVLLDTGKFDVQVSEDLKPLESADTLKSFDVLVLNRYNRTAPLDDAAKKNLLDFVRSGKGFCVQHLASASFAKWGDFHKLCGRYWVMGKSGHGPRSVFASTIADKQHPITAGLEGFKTDDELYAKLQGIEQPTHVLVEAYSDWSKKTEPLVFCHEFGKGRVVYNAYGHDAKALATPEVAKLTVRCVQWAATGKADK